MVKKIVKINTIIIIVMVALVSCRQRKLLDYTKNERLFEGCKNTFLDDYDTLFQDTTIKHIYIYNSKFKNPFGEYKTQAIIALLDSVSVDVVSIKSDSTISFYAVDEQFTKSIRHRIFYTNHNVNIEKMRIRGEKVIKLENNGWYYSEEYLSLAD
jgi:hypothetical protein